MADIAILDTLYNQAVKGVVGSESIPELAESYLDESGALSSKIDSLIRWQIAKCSTSGFLTGLGGVITLPVAIGADVGVNLYVHIRMSGAIAYMCGHDIYSDKVKTFVYVTLCGSKAADILGRTGVQIASKAAKAAIMKNITGEMLKKLNQEIGFQLFTKAGSRGLINFTKAVPIVGGLFGAAYNGVVTNAVGEAAKKIFMK